MDVVRTLGGVDVAYLGNIGYAVAVVVSYPRLKVIDESQVKRQVPTPYIPTYLGFREASIMAEALRGARTAPDVTLVDGHGVAHPRRFGLACHVGLISQTATVGVAKNHLYGDLSQDHLLDESGEVIGQSITLKSGKQLFVSIGCRVTLEDAVTLVKMASLEGPPEPLRLAHLKACDARRQDSR